MNFFSKPNKKLYQCFIEGNVQKAEKIIDKKSHDCFKPFSEFHDFSLSLAGALKTSHVLEAKQILKKVQKLNPSDADFYINEGYFTEFFFEYWSPVDDYEKIELDNSVLGFIYPYFDKKLFFEQLFSEMNTAHKHINLEKVSFVLELIVKDELHNKMRDSIYFLRGLCLLAEYKPQILKSTLIKYNKEIEKALKFHTNTDESKLIVQVIKHTQNSQKAA
jgi:uncharacterized UPF0160 family protein